MAVDDLEVKFLKYIDDITAKFVSDTSLIKNQYTKVDELLLSYGIDNTQKAQVIAELTKSVIGETGREINSSAIELLKIEEEQELRDVKLLIAKEELKIKAIEAEIAKTKLAQAKLELLGIKCKNELVCAQAATERAKKLDVEATTELRQAQKITEVEKAELTRKQQALVLRQKQGYGDNLLIKSGEFKGGLASFAMNSAPENPTTQTLIDSFNSTVRAIEQRSGQ